MRKHISACSGRSFHMGSRFCGPTGPGVGLRLTLLLLSFCAIVSSRPSFAASPPAKFHLLDATIDDVQRAIKTHQLTCTQLVQLYLARIKAYNGGPASRRELTPHS